MQKLVVLSLFCLCSGGHTQAQDTGARQRLEAAAETSTGGAGVGFVATWTDPVAVTLTIPGFNAEDPLVFGLRLRFNL